MVDPKWNLHGPYAPEGTVRNVLIEVGSGQNKLAYSMGTSTEKREPVQAYRVTKLCQECGEEMTPTGMVLDSYPPQHPHQCKNGHRDTFYEMYPRIEFDAPP